MAEFYGHENRECGEHRTVGSHRAWCFDDSEWCYPGIPCRDCELPKLRAEIEELREFIDTVPDQVLPELQRQFEKYRR